MVYDIQIENGIEYYVVHYPDNSDINYDELVKFQNEHEYNKIIIDTIGTFYNHFQLFHNEFGPSMILYSLDKNDNIGYNINGKRFTEAQFIRRLKLKNLNESFL